MALYSLHGLSLVVNEEGGKPVQELSQLLDDLSFVGTETALHDWSAPLVLSVSLATRSVIAPPPGRSLFRSGGLRGIEAGRDVYLTEGSSLLHLQLRHGCGVAHLTPAFFKRPPLVRQRFWAFGVMKLLRLRGCYGLHAAGIVPPGKPGLLLVGPSGSGKSTLTLGLIRHGWQYLSDDALLIRSTAMGVEALALRKSFSIDASVADDHADLLLGPTMASASGKEKRRADLRATHPDQHLPMCRPQVLMFPRIVSAASSSLQPVTQAHAFGQLLAHSGTALFDRSTMPQHMETLKKLVAQARAYDLRAGRDLLAHPTIVHDLLTDAEGTTGWRGSSSN